MAYFALFSDAFVLPPLLSPHLYAWVHAQSLQSCPHLCDPMDCSPPGSSIHGILQARLLKWVSMPSSRGTSQPRDQIWVSCIAGKFFTTEPLGKPLLTSPRLQLWGWGDGLLFYLSSSSPPFLESCFSWTGHWIHLCWMDIPDDIWFLGLFFAAPLKTQKSL